MADSATPCYSPRYCVPLHQEPSGRWKSYSVWRPQCNTMIQEWNCPYPKPVQELSWLGAQDHISYSQCPLCESHCGRCALVKGTLSLLPNPSETKGLFNCTFTMWTVMCLHHSLHVLRMRHDVVVHSLHRGRLQISRFHVHSWCMRIACT